jgi:hypothetical protein
MHGLFLPDLLFRLEDRCTTIYTPDPYMHGSFYFAKMINGMYVYISTRVWTIAVDSVSGLFAKPRNSSSIRKLGQQPKAAPKLAYPYIAIMIDLSVKYVLGLCTSCTVYV